MVNNASHEEDGLWKSLDINRIASKALIDWTSSYCVWQWIIETLLIILKSFIQQSRVLWRYNGVLHIENLDFPVSDVVNGFVTKYGTSCSPLLANVNQSPPR